MRKSVLIPAAIITPMLVVGAFYESGYGWLAEADRFPQGLTAKGGVTCRYYTLSGIRIAYYVATCPTFSTTQSSDESNGF